MASCNPIEQGPHLGTPLNLQSCAICISLIAVVLRSRQNVTTKAAHGRGRPRLPIDFVLILPGKRDVQRERQKPTDGAQAHTTESSFTLFHNERQNQPSTAQSSNHALICAGQSTSVLLLAATASPQASSTVASRLSVVRITKASGSKRL